jgi:hypothetical protein
MKKLLKWGMLFVGVVIILGTVVFAVSVDHSVPEGVDLGYEVFYLITFLLGGLIIFLSTQIKGTRNNKGL